MEQASVPPPPVAGRTEHWRPVAGWQGYYEVSNLGRVRSLPRTLIRRNGTRYRVRGRVLKPVPHRRGRWPLAVTLAANGTTRQYLVHRLVADAGERDAA